jgi:alkanesulfonate monooxygenase SsuD/methylene tetrahydromethanopterin reductase-like flavin-dependent oxidoreductase (luciferase family)
VEFYSFHLGDPNPGESDGSSLEDLLSDIEVADIGGFAGCFIAEHHNDRRKSLMSRPGVFMAAAAARTRHLRFGTMVTVLGVHHPYFVAEEIATLDALSNGRVEWGFGAGGYGWRQVGRPRNEAKERLEEGVELIKRMLLAGKSEAITYEGKFWSGKLAGVVPEVVQKPLPPFWISGHSQSTIDQAARLGLNFCTGFVSCEIVRNRRAAYHEAWERERGSEPPGRVAQMVLACVGDNRAEVERLVKPAMEAKLFDFARSTLGKMDDPSFTFDRALRERYYVNSWDELVRAGIVVYGTEEECTERLGEISDSAGEVLLLQDRFGELDRSFCRESVTRMATVVLPKVGGRPVDPDLMSRITVPATIPG